MGGLLHDPYWGGTQDLSMHRTVPNPLGRAPRALQNSLNPGRNRGGRSWHPTRSAGGVLKQKTVCLQKAPLVSVRMHSCLNRQGASLGSHLPQESASASDPHGFILFAFPGGCFSMCLCYLLFLSPIGNATKFQFMKNYFKNLQKAFPRT